MIATSQKGFTLIEVMIVTAIIGILAAIAFPAYQDYTIRAKFAEGLASASVVKTLLSEGYTQNRVAGMDAAAAAVNSSPVASKQSKYVANICVGTAGAPGAACAEFSSDGVWPIFITVAANSGNGIPATLNGLTFTLSPNVANAAPTAASSESIDWACAGDTAVTAAARGMTNIRLGTMPARYLPAECR